MGRLSPSIQRFLFIVSQVSELETIDAKLAATGRELSALLARERDMEEAGIRDRIAQRLILIGALRGEIAKLLALARSREALQVLGR